MEKDTNQFGFYTLKSWAEWFENAVAIALPCQGLSILNLSDASHQPVTSVAGCFVLLFSGEFYNRPALSTHVTTAGLSTHWCGRSNTETLRAALQILGAVRNAS